MTEKPKNSAGDVPPGSDKINSVLRELLAKPGTATAPGTLQRNIHFSHDLDRAALELTAYIANPKAPAPSMWESSYDELPYIVKSLLRRALVLEALWLRLTAEALQAPNDSTRRSLTKQASMISKDLLDVQSALYRATSDLRLTDKVPNIRATARADLPDGTTDTEAARAGDAAEAIYQDEYGDGRS